MTHIIVQNNGQNLQYAVNYTYFIFCSLECHDSITASDNFIRELTILGLERQRQRQRQQLLTSKLCNYAGNII